MAMKKKAAKQPVEKKSAKKVAQKRPVKPVPKGYGTVTATLNQDDAAATIAFCKKAFGAKVVSKMMAPGKKIMHSALTIGDSMLMVSDAVQDAARVSAVFLYVPNAEKTIAKAAKAGATVLMPATDMFWGDRFGRVKDPQGNLWDIATRIETVKPDELKKRTKAWLKQRKG